MKTSKLMLLVLVAVTLTVAGCAGHHGHGMGHDMGMHSGEAAVARGVVETNAMVDQTVKDPEKAKQAKAILQDIVAEVKGSAQTSRAFHEQMAVMNADYDAKSEQFTKVLDEMNNARMASATKILGLRFKMRALLTAQEWNELTGAMDKTRQRYQPKEGGK
ncbi:MAG: periplasmic heavy metal sensor [Nitrospiraceae bacterium]|nr:MAG: periplasmic heavy metal sensor [Nitrospiraceae bacterium]